MNKEKGPSSVAGRGSESLDLTHTAKLIIKTTLFTYSLINQQ
jgi:hypothetical protein